MNLEKRITPEFQEKKEKPEFLYHGSAFDVEVVNPKGEHKREEKENDVVFATPDIAFASMFLSPRSDDSWSDKGKYNDVYYIVCGDEKRFKKEDKGGFIYVFPGGSFKCDEEIGMGMSEWISVDSVTPIEKKYFPSGLVAMMENGVQVYFVTRKMLQEIKESEDHGMGILKNIKSENQKSGINPIDMFSERE